MTAADLLIGGAAGGAVYALARLRHYMAHVEPGRVEVTRHAVADPALPRELDGLTLCQVSDAHIHSDPRNREAVAAAIRSVEADLFLLTGDMVYRQAGVAAFFEWFDALAEAIRPAVAVLGNAEHKRAVDTREVLDGFAARGVPVLCNRTIRQPVRGGYLQIVGVDDPHSGHSDFEAAYHDAESHEWTLLLCHSPDGLARMAGQRADLMLCGHTHGGQVHLPLLGALAHNTGHVHGLYAGWYGPAEILPQAPLAAGVRRMYVSRGLGTTRIPFRLLCPPELPVFTLVGEHN